MPKYVNFILTVRFHLLS